MAAPDEQPAPPSPAAEEAARVEVVDDDHLVARLPVAAGEAPSARAVRRDGRWGLHLLPDLETGGAPPEASGRLLRALVEHLDAGDGTPVEWWVEDAGDHHERIAAEAGMVRTRELYQMRRPLPADQHATIPVRPFRPGVDDEAWLELNNAAFAWHEDQSGWTSDQLHARMAEPWFDPEGFLLHERDGRLAGFCWTKEHRAVVPALGEIFVIAVHPDFHGQGLGRELTLAGLDHLAARGLTVGMLYVEASNEPALRLYRSLGFEVHHGDRRYQPAPGGQAVLTPSSDPMP